VIGPGAIGGLHWATGHHRNGVLLAPLTAEIVAAGVLGTPVAPPIALDAFAPNRFATAGARA
jgi:glycine oxidase